MNSFMAKQYTIRFGNSVDPRIIEFLDMQGNKTDTITYLIEEELRKNGMRNLQKIIPPVRDLPKELPGNNKINQEEIKVSKNVVMESETIEIDDCFND